MKRHLADTHGNRRANATRWHRQVSQNQFLWPTGCVRVYVSTCVCFVYVNVRACVYVCTSVCQYESAPPSQTPKLRMGVECVLQVHDSMDEEEYFLNKTLYIANCVKATLHRFRNLKI